MAVLPFKQYEKHQCEGRYLQVLAASIPALVKYVLDWSWPGTRLRFTGYEQALQSWKARPNDHHADIGREGLHCLAAMGDYMTVGAIADSSSLRLVRKLNCRKLLGSHRLDGQWNSKPQKSLHTQRLQACSFFPNPFLEFLFWTTAFSSYILFQMLVHALYTLKFPVHCSGTREILKKVICLSLSQALFSWCASFFWIWTCKTSNVTDHHLINDSFKPANTSLGRDQQLPRWPWFFQQLLFSSVPGSVPPPVDFKGQIIFWSLHLDFLYAKSAMQNCKSLSTVCFQTFAALQCAQSIADSQNHPPVPFPVSFNHQTIFLMPSPRVLVY